MKAIKKLILTGSMIALVSGCGGREAPEQKTETETAAGQTAEEIADDQTADPAAAADGASAQDTAAEMTGEEATAEGISADASDPETDKPFVGVVTDEGGIEDASFNQSAWEGLQRLSGAYDCETLFLESYGSTGFEDNLERLIDQGADLCWGIGYSCADAILDAAGRHPDTSFAIVDYSAEKLPDNVTCVLFRAEEPAFLAGFVAGSMTETGKVGFIGGISDEIIDQFRYGYEGGVHYAAAKTGKSIEITAVYADSYSDAAKGRALAADLYNGGCDIIFHAAGETGNGVIEAAREANRYVIGVDKDQSYMAPEHVLTSVLKYVNTAILQISGDFMNGQDIGGRTVSLGLADAAAGLSENHELYPQELYDEVLRLSDDIISGRLKPPADEQAFRDFLDQLD